MIRTYRSGKVIEKSKVWVPTNAKVRRGRVKGNTSAAKRDRNAMQAVRQLARSMNCNCDHRWLHLVCSFDDTNLARYREKGGKLLKNFRDRLRRAEKRAGGSDLWWFEVPSRKDGESERPVREHVHYVLLLEHVRFEDGRWMLGDVSLEDIWCMGSIWAEPLHEQPDYTPLALYLLQQAERDEKKAYSVSRNLKKPIVTERLALTSKPLRAPAGAVVMEVGAWDAMHGTHYIRYKAPEGKKTDGEERGTS